MSRRHEVRREARSGFRPALILSLVAVMGCASSPESVATDRLVGCWYFEQGAVAEDLRLPWGVELTDRPLEGWPAVQQLEGVREALTLTPEGVRDIPFAYWRPHAQGDSVHLGHPGGSGFSVDLAVNPSSAPGPLLEGTIRPVGDVLRPGEAPGARAAAVVRLTRARCPS